MARKKKARRDVPDSGESGGRLAPADFSVDLDKPNPSPLDFVNRRMAEEDSKGRDSEPSEAGTR